MVVDLVKFFKDKVKDTDFHYKFNSEIDLTQYSYCIYEVEEAINELKKLTYPEPNNESNKKFILICFYLSHHGYCIKGFEDVISRPESIFAFSERIKKKVREIHGSSVATWTRRRELADSLEFIIKEPITNEVQTDLWFKSKIALISTRNSEWEGMPKDEKLMEICNLLENLLKDDGKYKILDYSKTFSFLTDSIVSDFRKKLQCFRHATKSAIKERESFSENTKSFMINFGVTVCIFVKDNSN
jgi:hypothetical protein